jgi:hypothetical protein
VLIASHVLLALILFFLVNWLGKHSITAGYHQITFIAELEEAPAFNALFRVLAPVVFLVITAAVWYAFELDRAVHRYYEITIFYFVLRWTFILVTGRRQLVRWPRQFGIALAACFLSYWAYTSVLRDRGSLLPDPANLANELWIVVLVFLYQTFNRIAWPDSAAPKERRRSYILSQYHAFRRKFGRRISELAISRVAEALAYSVMIYESFNRPPVFQLRESYILFPLGLGSTLGPMQVRTSKRLTAEESVELGIRKLSRDLDQSELEAINENRAAIEIMRRRDPEEGIEHLEPTLEQLRIPDRDLIPSRVWQEILTNTLKKYNVRSDYPAEVMGIFYEIAERYYPELRPQLGFADAESA